MNRDIDIPRRILVIRRGAMGDILVATPVLPNLRRAFPESHIAFLVDTRFRDVLKCNPYIDEVIEFDKKEMGRSWGLRRLGRELSFLLCVRRKRFDLVIDLLGSLRTAILSLTSGANDRIGYTYRVRQLFYNRRVKARNPQYVVDFNLDALRAMGISVESRHIHLPLDESDVSFADEWLLNRNIRQEGLLVGLFPGGGWPSKRWPLGHFSRLGDMLGSELNATVLIMGGPQERNSVKKILSLMKEDAVEVGELSLSRFAALVSRLSLFVSNDSGPRYLAVAADVPSIGIFGPTHALNANPTDSIHSAVTYGGDCIGCNKLFCSDQRCLKELSPESVFVESKRLLSAQGLLA